ncbi:hypothetical protein GCM10007978_29870 [Shewanella hanedai]|uniref:Uncharacterized protein n=1 Tax=Shewanella hanedai TaxID=25 RepID=A0A553JQX4_SHEHA|nr:hypothetical protein [Shewanella hanedai]TRY14854.1 hypothetical protein FN961_07630 [Shewanella hanedai]GGI90289.1 hypothetical protein GCM10007978_29870 [Shewanella hanedai]
MYWKVEDKKWVKARKVLWAELKKCLLEHQYSKKEVKYMEPYFLKGVRKQEDIAWAEPVPLIYCLAWHPSDDINVWFAEFQRIKSEARCEESMVGSISTSYILIKDNSYLYSPLNATENVKSLFLQREQLLYQFLFLNQQFLDDAYVKQAEQWRLEALRPLNSGALYCVRGLGRLIEEYQNDARTQPYFYAFDCYHLQNLSQYLSTEMYKRQMRRDDSEEKLGRMLATSLQFYQQRQQYSAAFQTIAELWFKQLDSDEIAPEWKNIWANARAGKYLTDDEYFSKDKTEEVDIENNKTNVEDELNQLLLDGTNRTEIIACLADHFEAETIELFDINDLDNIRSPYIGFIDPLEQLVKLRGVRDSVSYQDEVKDDVLTISLNEKVIGEINLDEVFSNETADYFQKIIDLAMEWFPNQALLSVEEGSTSLFILPSNIFKLLKENGIESDLLTQQ